MGGPPARLGKAYGSCCNASHLTVKSAQLHTDIHIYMCTYIYANIQSTFKTLFAIFVVRLYYVRTRTTMYVCTYVHTVHVSMLLPLFVLLPFVVVLSCHDSANFPGNCCGHGQTQPVNANIDYNKKYKTHKSDGSSNNNNNNSCIKTSSTTFARVARSHFFPPPPPPPPRPAVSLRLYYLLALLLSVLLLLL